MVVFLSGRRATQELGTTLSQSPQLQGWLKWSNLGMGNSRVKMVKNEKTTILTIFADHFDHASCFHTF